LRSHSEVGAINMNADVGFVAFDVIASARELGGKVVLELVVSRKSLLVRPAVFVSLKRSKNGLVPRLIGREAVQNPGPPEELAVDVR
ncbi:MAG: hypothetical protein AAFV01_13670, partial [Bacteroidota bacterium]